MNAYYDMSPGYCFVLLNAAGAPWRKTDDDDWDQDIFEPTGRERLAGFREIDGVRCAVFRCRDFRYRAQLLSACTRSPGRAARA